MDPITARTPSSFGIGKLQLLPARRASACLICACVLLHATAWPATSSAARLTTVSPAATAAAAAAGCGRTSRKIGEQGALEPVPSSGHSVTGTVRILDDCSFEVRGFTLTPPGPAVYFWGSSGVSRDEQAAGFRLAGMRIEGEVSTPATYSARLDAGLTWDAVGAVTVWCEQFQADFAHLTLRNIPAGVVAGSPPGRPATPAPPAVDIRSQLAHCSAASPGKVNIFWSPPSQGSIDIGIEVAFKQSAGWAGVGVNSPQAVSRVSMIGSDLVLIGFDNLGMPFAIPYMASQYSQCDYSATRESGVCPNETLKSEVQMLFASRTPDNVVTVAFRRPYTPLFLMESFGLWAYGPITEDQEEPVVLFHTTNHAPTDFRINFSSRPGNKVCKAVTASTAVTQRVEPSTVRGVLSFEVRVGPNPNYPNPPAWGVSYMVNGFESPVLEVIRGQTYTFNIFSGESHPFYITTSILGGSFEKDEKVLAGGPTSFSRDEKVPAQVMFQPNASTPSTVYYMCTIHQKIGWRINVVNIENGASGLHAMPSQFWFMMLVALNMFM